MGGSTHQFGPVRVCLHRDEHPCTLHAWGNWESQTEWSAVCSHTCLLILNISQIFSIFGPIHSSPYLFFPRSYTSSSPVVSYPVTRGTGRRVTKAVTASQMKWGANPTLIPDISLAHTLSQPQFLVLVLFPPQLQPPAVPPWARWGHHHRAAASGAIVDLPQVPIFLIRENILKPGVTVSS